jgi:hypothetical protein
MATMLTVQYLKAGSSVIDTTNGSTIAITEDGYVYEDPDNQNKITFVPEAQLEKRLSKHEPYVVLDRPGHWDGCN